MSWVCSIVLIVMVAVVLGGAVMHRNSQQEAELEMAMIDAHRRCVGIELETLAVLVHASATAIDRLSLRLLPTLFARAYCPRRIHVYVSNATSAVLSALPAEYAGQVTVVSHGTTGLVVREFLRPNTRYIALVDPHANVFYNYDKVAIESWQLAATMASDPLVSANGGSQRAAVSDFTAVDAKGNLHSRQFENESGARVYEQVLASPSFILGAAERMRALLHIEVTSPVEYLFRVARMQISVYTLRSGAVYMPLSRLRRALLAGARCEAERRLVHSLAKSRMARMGVDGASAELDEIQVKLGSIAAYNLERTAVL